MRRVSRVVATRARRRGVDGGGNSFNSRARAQSSRGDEDDVSSRRRARATRDDGTMRAWWYLSRRSRRRARRRVVARVVRRVDNHRSVPLCLCVPGDWGKTRAREEKTRRLCARGNGVVNEKEYKRRRRRDVMRCERATDETRR